MFVAPTYHPAYTLRGNRKYIGVVLHDVKRAFALLSGWLPSWKDDNYVLRPTVEAVEAFVDNCIRKRRFFELDIETNGEHPQSAALEIRCIGLFDGEFGICIPLLFRDGSFELVVPEGKKDQVRRYTWKPFYDLPSERRVIAALQRLLDYANVPFTAPIDEIRVGGQNLQFDSLCCFSKLGLRVPRRYGDDMLAHHIVASMHPHNLAFIASVNTDVNYYKSTEEGEAWSTGNDEELWIYCIRDCKAQWLSWQTLRANVQNRPEDVALYDFDLRLTNECEEWTSNGLLVDQDALELYRAYYLKRTAKALAALRRTVEQVLNGKITSSAESAIETLSQLIDDSEDPDFKPGSLPQLRSACEAIGIPLTHETDTGQLSTAKEFLLEARGGLLEKGVPATDPRIAFLDYLFAWREASKMESTFLRPVILGDGRVHPGYHVGPPTGRLASSGPNIQNQPGEIRGMYVARPGHVLVSIDWSAGELRLAGFIFNEKFLIDAFDAYDSGTGPKIHKVNASMIFGVPIDRLTDPIYRAGKVFAYACVERNTHVALLDGEKSICDVEPGDWTWCWDGAKYAPAKIKRVVCHGNKPCVKITMRSMTGQRKELIVTGDHRMLLRDGSYMQAGRLVLGDRLMPFRRWGNQGKYREIDPYNDGGRAYEHRWAVFGDRKSKRQVHHDNRNGIDNRPSNTEPLTAKQHRRAHGPIVKTPAGERSIVEKNKARWAKDHDAINATLIAGRKRSKWWQRKHAKSLERARAAKAGIAAWERAGCPRGVGKCFGCRHRSTKLAMGLCRKCYLVLYNKGLLPNHVVVAVAKVGRQEVWDLEVDHPAHNFALANSVFVANCCYGATEMTTYDQCRKEMPDMTYEHFKACYSRFKKGMPSLFAGMEALIKQGARNKYLDSPIYGRRVYFFEKMNGFGTHPEASRMQNFPEQSGLTEFVVSADFRIQDRVLPKWRKKCRKGEVVLQLTQVHDELLYEVPERFADPFLADVTKVAQERLPKQPTWRMPVEGHHSKRWKPIPLEVFLASEEIKPSLWPDALEAAREKLDEVKADLKKVAKGDLKREKLIKQRDAILNLIKRVSGRQPK